MDRTQKTWELKIIDVLPYATMGCLSAYDIDGDGRVEIITGGGTLGGDGALHWYRPEILEKGTIRKGNFAVGMVIEDIDQDGRFEVAVGEKNPDTGEWMLTWYKPGRDLNKPWARYIADSSLGGALHDIIAADLDGDGEKELLVATCGTDTPGVFACKRNRDIKRPWRKYTISEGVFTEGLSAGDINGDGRLEIICGPDWYEQPSEGTFAGSWKRKTYAPNFREMSRTSLIDITGNGRPDIVITDSEYLDGYISWFENRLLEDPSDPWIEHRIEEGMLYSHSLYAWNDGVSKEIKIFVAEMALGGWEPPYNYDARLIIYSTSDRGKSWNREVIYKGEGTHQAAVIDTGGDGEVEIIGKTWQDPRVQIWKLRERPSLNVNFKHKFIDRDKPYTGTDILSADIDGDGLNDIVCGAWWYKNPGWKRYVIPGIGQAINAYDIDRDGQTELIAIKKKPGQRGDFYKELSNDLCWVKPVDPLNGKWEEHPIGKCRGDWPHGSVVAPLLPDGKLALVTCYHDSMSRKDHPPEIFTIPDDPKVHPWKKKVFAKIRYNEEIVAYDINGNGRLDLVTCQFWFENLGNGRFKTHKIARDFKGARLGIADINGDGRPDIVAGEEVLDYENKVTPFSRLVWFENPGNKDVTEWRVHVIDKIRCAHSLAVADIDGDGEPEIICGEHDPFWPYRKRCRLFVYKKADPKGRAWYRYLIDGRFEHHDGTKIFEVAPGRVGLPGKVGIISHGWRDSIYVNLWEIT
jgi:hypothetical protein